MEYQPLNILINPKIKEINNSFTLHIEDTSHNWKQRITIFRNNKIQIHSVENSKTSQLKLNVLESLNETLILKDLIERQEKIKNSLSKKRIIDTDSYQSIPKRTRLNSNK